MPHTSDLTEGSISRSLIRLAVPIVLANVLQSAYQLTDTFWVGRLGADAVAAISLSFPIVFLLISMGAGFGIAGTVLVAQYKGSRNSRMVDVAASQTYLVMVVVALFISVLGYLISPVIVDAMVKASDVREMAVSYLQISMIGLVFMYTYIMFQSLFRGIGNVKTPLWIVLMSVVLNFFLDPLFIMGYGPVPPHGVAGAAYATICTQALAALVGTWLMVNGRHGFSLSWHLMKPNWGQIRQIFALGLPASAEQSTRGLAMIVMTFLVASFGTVAIASYGIGVRVLSFMIIPSLGFSMATSALVGQNIGAGKIDRAKEVARIATWTIFVVLSFAGFCFFVGAEEVLNLFVPGEEEVIQGGKVFIRIIALTFGLVGVQQVVSGALRGGGSTLTAMLLAMLSLWVFRFPVAYVLSKHTPLVENGIWWSFAISNVLAATVSCLVLFRGTWLKRVVGDFDPVEREVLTKSQLE